ncbi:hypothetical protein G3N96_28145 [Burkholderia sp. Se-20373]|uniref:hypothetical protein n=1 Tax=Burkholderia TaxID=32008 RepID=UPI00162500FD|nr:MULTISPECIES: hypothetical protein [Burkholderia]MBN3749271.1 hypothetical protein [Burkholderia sp. Se-20373]
MRDQQRSHQNNGVTGADAILAYSAALPPFAAILPLRARSLRIPPFTDAAIIAARRIAH